MESKGQIATEEPLISVSELAKRLRKTPQVIRKMASRGDIPYYGVPSSKTRRHFKLSEVLAAIKQNGDEAKAA